MVYKWCIDCGRESQSFDNHSLSTISPCGSHTTTTKHTTLPRTSIHEHTYTSIQQLPKQGLIILCPVRHQGLMCLGITNTLPPFQCLEQPFCSRLPQHGVHCREIIACWPNAFPRHIIHVYSGITANNDIKCCVLTHTPCIEARGTASMIMTCSKGHIA